MIELCKPFIECSSEIKTWLSKQPEVKEESLTDWFLYNLSEKTPTIKYKQFTRNEEGQKTGADWEWWFVFSNKKSFAARIQAKKIKVNGDNYPGIAYSNSKGLQIELLLEDSANENFASFYSFYSTEDSSQSNCKKLMPDGGVFFGEANKLRDEFILKGRRRLDPKDIIQFTHPISCFFCCPLTSKLDIESGFRAYLSQYFPTWNDNRKENSNQQQLGFKETPNYIRQLLSDNVPEFWEAEYSFRFRNVDAVIAIDLR